MRFTACLLLCLTSAPAGAQTMMQALQQHDWATARTLAAAHPDPLAEQLVTFIRLLQPGQATAAEIDQFLHNHADWPDQALLARRLDEALAEDADSTTINHICATRTINAIPALLRCADTAGHAQGAVYARKAWVGGITDIAGETDFLRHWADVLTPDDDWARFDRLTWSGDAAAVAQVARLDGAHAAAAQARLAFRHDDTQALILLGRVPENLRADPSLVLEQARSLRRTDADAAAVALWHEAGAAAEASAPASRHAAFWAERDALARKLLEAAMPAEARAVATDPQAAPDQRLDMLFLCGWIALRRLHDTAGALTAFQALAQETHSVISRARAYDWLGRAADAAGDVPRAQAAYTQAAAFPTSFYGQLAATALHAPAAPMQDPGWTSAQAIAFTGAALPRAAEILSSWGDRPRARGFLLAAVRTSTLPADFALAAHLATALGVPETAVQIARLAGRQGIMLPEAGWPMPFHPAGPLAPLVLGVMRQESSFDPGAISPAGAVGLMQMLPATAAETARHGGGGGAPNLFDPATNMRLGTAYLQTLLDTFGQAIPVALAAYNAGPRHARAWLAANGDPAAGADAIDWIEAIPFAETRNYVQRVMENAAMYGAKRDMPPGPVPPKKS